LATRLASGWLVDALLLYFALGARSLAEHARAVAEPLEADRLPDARRALARIVSRDTRSLSASEVSGAAVESVLENGSDAIFGTLFWFAVLGGPGALLFRLANTLDAMWGYRTPRFAAFGWAAARADDVLGYLPARLTALSYALVGHTRTALACWRAQAPAWDSPNAGPVMASGAGALDLRLGGPAIYDGVREERPILGCGSAPDNGSIHRALRLVRSAYWMWIALLAIALAVAQGLPPGVP
jgi:adenosylcobinamide-phosphate synthase